MRKRWPRSFCRYVVVVWVLLWMLSFLYMGNFLPGQSWSEGGNVVIEKRKIIEKLKNQQGIRVNNDHRISHQTHTAHKRLRRRKRKRNIEPIKEHGGYIFQNKVEYVKRNASRLVIGQNENEDVTFPPFVTESEIDGPGENGTGAKLKLSKYMQPKSEAGFKKYQFNVLASDIISVRRRLPDIRSHYCLRAAEAYTDLPEASIIMCFRNEAWSVLLRSVHSILNRTPPSLLREIILVDDFSSEDFLKAPLDKYMLQFPNVKVIRTLKREGLIRARLIGVRVATAPVLIFLDSHIECLPGWIEPLLARIKADDHIVPIPLIDSIVAADFHIMYLATAVGSFSWNLQHAWDRKVKVDENVHRDAPRRSATMPGGLFAISKRYFLHIGTYDPELDFWGGENMELSFKVWMCYGSIELVPCSHVAHVFRPVNPNTWPSDINNHTDPVKRNQMRVAEVWMDEYKQYVYEIYNYKLGDFGDVSKRKQLRQRLGCRSFDWFMKTVLPHKYVPRDVAGVGEIRSAAFTEPMCVDSLGRNKLHLRACHGQGLTQFWYITRDGAFAQDPELVCVLKGPRIIFSESRCKSSKPCWTYRQDNSIFHSQTELCLEVTLEKTFVMTPCEQSARQQWIMARERPKLKENY